MATKKAVVHPIDPFLFDGSIVPELRLSPQIEQQRAKPYSDDHIADFGEH